MSKKNRYRQSCPTPSRLNWMFTFAIKPVEVTRSKKNKMHLFAAYDLIRHCAAKDARVQKIKVSENQNQNGIYCQVGLHLIGILSGVKVHTVNIKKHTNTKYYT